MSRDFPGRSQASHGTPAGFQMHKAQGSMVCDDCRLAANKYVAQVMREHYDPVKRRARYLKQYDPAKRRARYLKQKEEVRDAALSK